MLIVCFAAPLFGQTEPAPGAPQSGTAAKNGAPVLQAGPPARLTEPSRVQVEIAQAHAWQLLTNAYKSKKASDRAESLNALSMLPDNARAFDMIEAALSDRAPEVRAQAANVLGQMNATRSIPKIKPLLKDKSPDVAFAAARALSQLGDPSGRDVLIEVLTGERHVSGGVVDATKDWTKQFTFRNVAFLGAAQGATIFAGPLGAVGVSALQQILFQDHTSTTRASSAQALAPDGSQRVIEILEKALKDKDWTVRFSAANALGVAPTTQPVPQLENMLRDKKSAVRLVSAVSIVRLASTSPPKPQAVSLQEPGK